MGQYARIGSITIPKRMGNAAVPAVGTRRTASEPGVDCQSSRTNKRGPPSSPVLDRVCRFVPDSIYGRVMTSITELARSSGTTPSTPLGFRSSPRGATGWAALLLPGSLAAAAAALVIARGRPGPVRVAAFAAGGVLVSVLVARVVDEARWRSSAVSLEVDEPDAALDLMQAVRAEGVHADMVRSDDPHAPSGVGYALRYRAKDDRRVRAVLAAQQR